MASAKEPHPTATDNSPGALASCKVLPSLTQELLEIAVAYCPPEPPLTPYPANAEPEKVIAKTIPPTTLLEFLDFVLLLTFSETATHAPNEAFHITLYILFIGYSSLNFATEGTLVEYLCAVYTLSLIMCKLHIFYLAFILINWR
ncbi:hypothetical protein VXQ08_01930 [Acinetobacter towneri]|nr:hypothetical protein [Acinetobacter towneri]